MSRTDELIERLEGKRVVFQHKKGPANHEHFSNDEKVATVVSVSRDDIENDRPYPIKLELPDGAKTYVEANEINRVIDNG